MIPLEPAALLLALAHVMAGVMVLVIAKLIKDLLTPYKLDAELTAKDNPAVGLAVAGYFAGVLIVYVSAARAEGLPLDAGSAAALRAIGIDLAWALGGVLALNLSRWLMDRLLLPAFANAAEIVERRNTAVGVVEAGCYIAGGLVLAGAVRERGGTILTAIAFFLLSQLVVVAYSRLYSRLCGYSMAKEIQTGNLAAGVAFGLSVVAMGVLMLKATSGEFVDWQTNLTYFGFDAVVGFALLLALRGLTDAALMPGARIPDEIARDRNVNAGLLEGVVALSVSVLILVVF